MDFFYLMEHTPGKPRPKGELEALGAGSNLMWDVKRALEKFVDEEIAI